MALIRAVLAALTLALSGSAQATETELHALTRQWVQAVYAHDKAAIDRFLAPDFFVVSPGTSVAYANRQQWLDGLAKVHGGSCEIDQFSQRPFGEVTLVSAHLNCLVNMKGVGIKTDSVVVDVWGRKDGQWQVKARYVSATPSLRPALLPVIAGVLIGFVLAAVFVLIRQRMAARR